MALRLPDVSEGLLVQAVGFNSGTWRQEMKKGHLAFWSLLVVVALSLVEISGSVLCGQNQAASIVGVLSDPNGNAIPDATVSVSSPALQVTKLTTTTDSQGAYKFLNRQFCAESRGHNCQDGAVRSVQGPGDKHPQCENC